MNEIIAAFIIACSNLGRADMPWTKERIQCVQRVAKCAEKITHSRTGDLDRAGKVLETCAQEVHL